MDEEVLVQIELYQSRESELNPIEGRIFRSVLEKVEDEALSKLALRDDPFDRLAGLILQRDRGRGRAEAFAGAANDLRE